EEGFDFTQGLVVKQLLILRHCQHIAPGGNMMKGYLTIFKAGLRLRKYSIKEEGYGMIHNTSGRAYGVDKLEHAAAGSRQIFDHQDASALRHVPLDLCIAPVTLRRLSNVNHRQGEPLGQERSKRDPGCFTTCNTVKLFKAGFAQ